MSTDILTRSEVVEQTSLDNKYCHIVHAHCITLFALCGVLKISYCEPDIVYTDTDSPSYCTACDKPVCPTCLADDSGDPCPQCGEYDYE